jgi:hypothetical protein
MVWPWQARLLSCVQLIRLLRSRDEVHEIIQQTRRQGRLAGG